jgi:hypothetical protein
VSTPADLDADAVSPAEAVAEAVVACPGVVRLGTGAPIEVATYLPGRRVHGVRMADGAVEVHVVARPGTVLPDLAEAVRRAVTAVVPVQRVDVYVDDLDTEPENDAEQAPPGEAVTA